MLKNLARHLLSLLGWKLVDHPDRPPRAVLVAYPHTSNWDALHALLGKTALGLSTHWVAKDSLFRWPFGSLLRRMGGIPVNRRARSGFVEQMAAQFSAHPSFYLTIAPEGSRSREAGWKTGFYRIALAADVPVALACVDYARREIGILCYLKLSGDPAIDIAHIAAVYAGRAGRVREGASPIRWLD